MERRNFIKAGALSAAALVTHAGESGPLSPRSSEFNLPPLPFQDLKSKLKEEGYCRAQRFFDKATQPAETAAHVEKFLRSHG